MTPTEIHRRLKALRTAIGGRAYVSVSLSVGEHGDSSAVIGAVYPDGVTGGKAVRAESRSWEDLLDRLESGWAEHAAAHRAVRVREMALRIISITADEGGWTPEDLRRAGFDAAEIESLRPDAAREAVRLSGGHSAAPDPAAPADGEVA